MWINRHIEQLLLNVADTRPAVVLTGARQTGKTSLMQRLFPAYNFVSLDSRSEAEQAELYPEMFLSRHAPPVIIDEIQYAPNLFRHLKTVIDQNRRSGSFLLTGSVPFPLMRSVSESLAGRVAVLNLEPLSFAEVKAVYPDITA
ncbi:MAG: AAA family ATPase, partial [Gammaproteobacteria bacterium]|nr:AAA family ATPase [Gammaproteobacteria bacterium]